MGDVIELGECEEWEGLAGELGSDDPDYIHACQRGRDAATSGTQCTLSSPSSLGFGGSWSDSTAFIACASSRAVVGLSSSVAFEESGEVEPRQ